MLYNNKNGQIKYYQCNINKFNISTYNKIKGLYIINYYTFNQDNYLVTDQDRDSEKYNMNIETKSLK